MKTEKNTRNNLPQSRLNQTQKKDKSHRNQYKSIGSIPTYRQLQLFISQPSSFLDGDDPPAYPLQIKAIPYEKRVKPSDCCKLVHYESGLNIPGQFTYDEAKEILETTRYWDWELDPHRIPRCVERLRSLLENICSRASSGGAGDA